jgi:hypothetical protein
MLAEPRGADSNQVRVLVPGIRRRLSTRRRMQRFRRQVLREAEREIEDGPELEDTGASA